MGAVARFSATAPQGVSTVAKRSTKLPRASAGVSTGCSTVNGVCRAVPSGRHFHSSVAREAKKTGGRLKREVTMVIQSKLDEARDFAQGIPGKISAGAAAAGSYLATHSLRALKDPRLLVEWSRYAWHAVAHFVKHMWTGGRLLAKNVRIASGLMAKSALGRKLIRREERLLLRTVSDLGRLIPFSFFIIIPFMELLLPVALKIFPNLLPSTFAESGEKEKMYAQTTKTRLELAKEMQEGLLKRLDVLSQSEGDDEESNDVAQAAQDFRSFVNKIRDGKTIGKDDITRNARWFKDEFTIDSVSRAQLEAMCTFMGIPTYGADSVLRFQIRHRLRQIQADDRKIWWEGIQVLDSDDLIEANHDRGMPHEGYTREKLEAQLARWIDLSMNNAVPPSLLILSRTFVITTTDRDTETGEALRAAIKSIEKEVVEEIEEELAEDLMELVEKKKKATKGEEEKTKAEEAAEDLEELQREIDLINEEKKVIADIEQKDKQREQELEQMRVELAEIMSNIDMYTSRVGVITEATRNILQAQKDDESSFVDNIEVLQEEDDRQQEAARIAKHAEEIEFVTEKVKSELLKTEAAAKAADRKAMGSSGSSMKMP